MATSSNSLETESSSREKLDNIVNDDYMIKLVVNEIIRSLDLDGHERKDQIINELLENGRQSLTKFEEDIAPKIYLTAMKGNDNELLKSLKNYFEQQWKVQYGSSNKWFVSFLRQYQKDDNYECVLNRTAEYGNKYMKTCPTLSIVVQILFDGLSDQHFNESNEFNELWLTITNNGLKSIEKYSEYIAPLVLNKLLNKEHVVLFLALREFYRPELFELLQETNIRDRDNLYESVLDNVAEHGWLTGLEASRDNIVPKFFKRLLEKISSSQKHQQTTISQVTDDGETLVKEKISSTLTESTLKSSDTPVKQGKLDLIECLLCVLL
ncbi:unnamed protein product [Rotaria sp. Silwood2]|nr:unnamed protein product [Rotaria sp. Silwood2]CAF3200172.1 unnamed protein product [Rotaria sp. Silwood2]CAF4370660.1 unnamed protein product [Rotaria sp. Silwood2]CAF4575337.1 unnamed protein product [Rotaria sp. Silwood2]